VVVLIVWIAAVVVTGLILGIAGYGLSGQLSRLRRAVITARGDVQPRVLDLAAQMPAAQMTAAQLPAAQMPVSRKASAGRHSAERQRNTDG
jgi:hypothetical protein